MVRSLTSEKEVRRKGGGNPVDLAAAYALLFFFSIGVPLFIILTCTPLRDTLNIKPDDSILIAYLCFMLIPCLLASLASRCPATLIIAIAASPIFFGVYAGLPSSPPSRWLKPYIYSLNLSAEDKELLHMFAAVWIFYLIPALCYYAVFVQKVLIPYLYKKYQPRFKRRKR